MSAFKGVDLLDIDTGPKYYWLLTKAAFSKGWSIFGAANLFLAFIAWALTAKYPRWQAKLNDLTWQIPAALGLAAIAGRWLYAPWDVHKKTIKQADKRIVAYGDKAVAAERAIVSIQEALPDLHIRFDPNDESMWWKEERWCRIVVVNDSPTAMARNVEVRAMKMTPYRLGFKALPSRLGLKGGDNRTECRIAPKGTQLFDVFRWAPLYYTDFILWIIEVVSGQKFDLPVGEACDLTIEVVADHVQPKTYVFRISRAANGETTFLDVTP
jgi:hypothetical protein